MAEKAGHGSNGPHEAPLAPGYVMTRGRRHPREKGNVFPGTTGITGRRSRQTAIEAPDIFGKEAEREKQK